MKTIQKTPGETVVARATAGVAALLLAGCAGTPPVAQQWHRLPLQPVPALAPAAAAPSAQGVLAIAGVRLADHLDRDAILVTRGATGLEAVPGHRWAEPLREALPRLLRADLAARLGAEQVWLAPLPAGVVPARTLRVEILQLDADPQRREARLVAQWTVADAAAAGRPPLLRHLELRQPAAGDSVEALLLAQRVLLARLASAISP